MESKKWYASKTMWVNLVAAAAGLSGIFGFQEYLDAEVQASIVTAIMAVVNIALRIVTKSGVSA